ncbi:MAG: hypothetical protein RIT38_16 [Bacteroidota bacterium]
MFFATLFDKNYIPRATALINSLKSVAKNDIPEVFILSLDDVVYNYFSDWENVHLISLNDIENKYPELYSSKGNRSFVEYIFTLSPFLPLYILETYLYVNRITSVDSDLLFINDPFEVLNNLGDDKIGITRHGFEKDLLFLEKYGKYNVSFQSFPNSNKSIMCLKKWAKDCIEYCGDELDDLGRFADQKYLDNWIEEFQNVVDFPSPTVGLAPWNVSGFDRQLKPIFYHFHDFRLKSSFHITLGLNNYNITTPSRDVIKLYAQYWRELKSNKNSIDNKLVRHAGATNNWVFLRDLKHLPILIRLLGFHIYVDLKNRKLNFYLF